MLDMASEQQCILAVDDNPYTLRIVQHALEKVGYDVQTALSGADALTYIERHGLPHLVIVDMRMPGMNGIELARKIQAYSDVPIMMLTAVNDEETIVQSIDEFAEDYIVKPFSPGELVARVRRVIRRMGNYAYTFNDRTMVDEYLEIDFAQRKAVVGGKSVSLTPTETKLLFMLMRNAGRIVTADFLLRRLWPMEEAFEDRLHVHIHRLRRKIESAPNQPQYIVSERGAGYRFPAMVMNS